MREKIIGNIILKLGSRMQKEDLDYIEIILCEELQGIAMTKESTELAEYNDSIEKLKNIFLATLAVENKSSNTIKQYDVHLRQFAEYFTGKDINEIDSVDIRGFLFKYKQERSLSNTSLNNKRCVLSSFFTWLCDEEYISKNPMRRVKKIKTTKKKKMAYTEKEMEQMRLACGNIRDRALIEMLSCTGCRVSELSGIDISDVNFEKKEITILGKGDKERSVFISDQASLYLDLYLNTRNDVNNALFVTKRKPFSRLRKDGIERIVRMLGERCNIRAYPHKFRRTFCTRLINRGMPAQDVAILMGHTDVNMTCNVYYDANSEQLYYQYKKYVA